MRDIAGAPHILPSNFGGRRLAYALGAIALVGASLARSAEPSSTTPDTVAGQDPAALESVEVTARREALRAALTDFVARIARTSGSGTARWREALCPWAGSGSPEEGKYLETRLRDVAASVGAGVAEAGKCTPNFLVFLTEEPGELVAQLKRRGTRLFAGATPRQIERFLDATQVVHVWQTSATQNADGDPVVRNASKAPEYRLKDSRIVSSVAESLETVLVVVDTGKTGTATFGQLADYIAMVALAQVDADAELGDAASILQLFAQSPRANVPSRLTDWDEAFLKALYGMRDSYQQERTIIVTRMMQQLEVAR